MPLCFTQKEENFLYIYILDPNFHSQTIVEEKEKGDLEPKPLRFLQKIEKPIPRPPTPTVDVPSEVSEHNVSQYKKMISSIHHLQINKGGWV